MNAKKKAADYVMEYAKIIITVAAALGILATVARPYADRYVTSIHETQNKAVIKRLEIQLEETQKEVKKVQQKIIFTQFLISENLNSKQIQDAKDKWDIYMKNN